MISVLFSLTLTATAHPNHTQDWENWDTIEICATDHELCHTVVKTQARPTRNQNILRFTDPALREAQFIELHLLRLSNPTLDQATRSALVELIASSKGEWEEGLKEHIHDSDAVIRARIAESTRFASSNYASFVYSELNEDPNAEVRATVFRAMAKHDTTEYQSELLKGLEDPSGMVRLAAIRTIGWTHLSIPIESLESLLTDVDPNVRLHSLRSIFRLYPEQAQSLSQLKALLQDVDPKVQREAQRIKAYDSAN